MVLQKAQDYLQRRFGHIDYKWIALSNTTLGTLMVGIDSTILLIALPAIFRGIGINPLNPGEVGYLLWTLMGFTVVTSMLLVSVGRLSDLWGRVRLYNLGFLIFTIGSILLALVAGNGNQAAIQIIVFRAVQAIGAAFLFANSAAILTDAFPSSERGFALGINQIAFIGGNFLGLLIGGVLAPIDWRLVFLVSVPFGLIGTVWAYLMLKDTKSAAPKKAHSLDIMGNVLLAGGMLAVLTAMTYGLMPYGADAMGWSNPLVLGLLALGLILLGAFGWYESKAKDPMFDMGLFKIRTFLAGNLATFLSALARGGLQFMLIIWLQGIWLPLHGVSFEDTPFWSAIYMLPLTIAFLLAGPISGWLSDRYGPRKFAIAGMLMDVMGFLLLSTMPANFSYPEFAAVIGMMGVGLGLFAAPNMASIMSSVPPEHRGAASGMRATLQTAASTLSIAMIFTMVTLGLAGPLPAAMHAGLTNVGVSSSVATSVAQLPASSALFASFLGYNPLGILIPPAALAQLSSTARASVLSVQFFPSLLSGPFIDGTHLAFLLSAAIAFVAALASTMHEKKHFPPPADSTPEAHEAFVSIGE